MDLAVAAGEVFGFLGPNGAGKSTTVRMLPGFLPPTEGKACLAGHDMAVDPVAGREMIGVVPEEANVYADLPVWQNMMLKAELRAVGRRRRTERGTELLGLFGLAGREREKGGDLSKGLRQRLMLCMALVGDPEILFLGEPTTGLDVASVHAIRRTVLHMNRERGTTVFLTTHNIEEAGEFCHRVAIIHEGRIVAVGMPEALRGRIEARRSAEVCFATPGVRPSEVLDTTGREVMPLAGGFRVYGPDPGAMGHDIAAAATARGLRIRSLNTRAPSLEESFLHLSGGETPRPGDDGAR